MARDDLLAPRYLISVEGTTLSADVTQFISSVEYEEDESASSRITLEVTNKDFRFLDERIFAEGNSIDLWMGYAGKPLHFMNRGVIVDPAPQFPRGGIPRLTVVAMDKSQSLMTAPSKDKGKTYTGTDSEIASQIFQEEGISPFTRATKGSKKRTRKRGTNRWEFLRHLAEIHDYVLDVSYDPIVRDWVGYFGPRDVADQETAHVFVYGTGEADATLLEFRPRSNLPSQSTRVEVVYTDPKTRRTHRIVCEVRRKDAERTKFTALVGKDKLRETIPNGPSVVLTCWGQREEVIADRQFSSPADAKRWAATWWNRRQGDFAWGAGTIVGSPDLRKGQVHSFVGLGPRYTGDWQLSRVAHQMSGLGLYEVEFDARKVALDSVIGSPEDASGVRVEGGDL